MTQDRSERRGYRKSPGRHYGYEYDPLQSRNERSQSGRSNNSTYSERRSAPDETASRSGALLAPRPDPRKTRQLLRQYILASKSRPVEGEEDQVLSEVDENELIERRLAERRMTHVPVQTPQEYAYTRRHDQLQRVKSGYLPPHLPLTRELEAGADPDNWLDVDPHTDYETYDYRAPAVQEPTRSGTLTPARPRTSTRLPEPPAHDDGVDEYYEEEYYEDDEPTPKQKKKKGKLSRRALFYTAGAIAVGGAGYYGVTHLAPNVPKVVGDFGKNVEHQVEEAFKQGQDAARKEILTALENLEGFTLEGAVNAARLTRVAYDVFVSPIIQFGATISADFLNSMLKGLRTGRGWLLNIGQDNVGIAAVQKVLESWVSQVGKMPRQIDAITQTDLDGAQAYLRNLQRKIEEEKAKLNGKQPTPGPTKKPNP